MPYRDPVVPVLATLAFDDAGGRGAGGEIVLRDDACIQLIPSPALLAELEKLVGVVDQTTLKWGASAVALVAAAGAMLFWRGKRRAAFATFAASGLTGLGAFAARRYILELESWILTPMPLEQVTIEPHESTGGLRISLNAGGLRKLTALIGPNEYDRKDAAKFLDALESARLYSKG